MSSLLAVLNKRRRQLRMSYACLARRAGLAESTVQRHMGERDDNAIRCRTFFRLLSALGGRLELRPKRACKEAANAETA